MSNLIKCLFCKEQQSLQEFEKVGKPEKPYSTCNTCRINRRATYARTVKGTRDFVCKVPGCGKKFVTNQARVGHVKAEHDNIRDHVCPDPDCDYKSSHKSALDLHIKASHDKIRDIQCPQCPKSFSYGSSLAMHIKVEHDKIRDIQCPQCIACFSDKANLSKHIKSEHDNIRDHICPTPGCDYKTSQKGNLTLHIKLYCNGGERGSSGEITVKKVLDVMMVTYEREKYFTDCKRTRHLRFDFYLPQHSAIIEFDGEQHFNAIDFYGGVETLERTQLHDAIKNAYCVTNNIHLLRIKYTDQHRIHELVASFVARLEPGRIISQYMGCGLQSHIILPYRLGIVARDGEQPVA